jgi:hypothetical protein
MKTVEGPDGEAVELPAVRPVKVERLMRREARSVQKRQCMVDGQAPNGASQEAVAIYTALAKTYKFVGYLFCRLPCYWYRATTPSNEPPTIVVLEEVYVCPPYTPGSCRGTIKSNAGLVDRVKKVLEGERRRLGLDN